MPCNYSGYLDPEISAQWGVVDFVRHPAAAQHRSAPHCAQRGLTDSRPLAIAAVQDWSNAKGLWARSKPMDCEKRLVAQADLVRSVNADAKVWVCEYCTCNPDL